MIAMVFVLAALMGIFAGIMYCTCSGETEIKKIILYIAVPTFLCVIFTLIFMSALDAFETFK